MNVAVVLAAGASRRMGRPKALLPLGGRTCLERVVATANAAGLQRIVIVVAAPHGALIEAARPATVEIAWNEAPERGMFSSLQRGFAHVSATAECVLMWPIDHPLVAPATLHRLLAAPPHVIAVPRHEHRGGHPVRIPRCFFAALAAHPHDSTLRHFMQERSDAIHPIAIEDPWTVRDLDTAEDAAYADAWLKRFASRDLGEASG